MKKILLILCVALSIVISCTPETTQSPPPEKEEVKIEDFSISVSAYVGDMEKNATTISIDLQVDTSKINDSKIEVIDELIDSNNTARRSSSTTYTIEEAKKGNLEYDVQYYGKHKITLKLNDGSKTYAFSSTVVFTAAEYNMACLIATVPATDFTLIALDKGGTKDTIDFYNPDLPTVITLERAQAYNWDNLPDNMTICPFMSEDKVRNGYLATGWNNSYSEFWEYVIYLYKLNPESKFNFYLNDYWPDHIFNAFSGGIPLENMTITFITDGTASFSIIRDYYGDGTATTDNSLDTYNTYSESWEKVKTKLNAGDLSGYKDELISGAELGVLRPYLPVLINDSEIKVYWVVNNTSTNNFGTSEVYTEKVQKSSSFKSINMNTLLNNLNNEEQEDLKLLYSFDNSEFIKAQANGKKILVFLGTSTRGEGKLEDAIKIMKSIYGDEYAYFYKGHPGHVMNDSGNRERIAKDNGVTIIDASMPAELVYFFNPAIEMGGYQSSTFTNLTSLSVAYIFFPGDKTSLDYDARIKAYSTLTDSGEYLIVKDAQTSEQSYAYWNPSNDISSITWTRGDLPTGTGE